MMLAFAFASLGIYAQYPATSDVLEFQNRKIDVAPFFDGFPFSQFRLSDDGSKLFFLKSGAESRMQWIELDGKQTPFAGKDAIDADLSKRNGWKQQQTCTPRRLVCLINGIKKGAVALRHPKKLDRAARKGCPVSAFIV